MLIRLVEDRQTDNRQVDMQTSRQSNRGKKINKINCQTFTKESSRKTNKLAEERNSRKQAHTWNDGDRKVAKLGKKQQFTLKLPMDKRTFFSGILNLVLSKPLRYAS